MSEAPPAAEKAAPHKRRVEARLPSVEMKQEFMRDAEERGGVSSFITYLYRDYKRRKKAEGDEGQKAA